MKVSGFMIPAEHVATCEPHDTIKRAVDRMLASKVGCLVVLMKETDFAQRHVPVGIVTKTDLAVAYQKEVSLEHAVKEIMTHDIQTIRDNVHRDQAAKFFRAQHIHHAVVVNEANQFVGLVSSWDIASECVRDAAAWPWIRTEDGKFHKPTEASDAQTAAQQSSSSPRSLRDSHAFLDFVDSVRELPFMDD